MPESGLRVLFVVSECAPFAKTGGLGDVAGALPKALAAEGVSVRVLMPLYAGMERLLDGAERLGDVESPGGALPVWGRRAADLDLLLIDAPGLYRREGGPYGDRLGRDWPDNAWRFATLAYAGARIAREGIAGWRPDVLHAHDWQAGLAPAYLKLWSGGPTSVITIHNIAFQGAFDAGLIHALRLPREGFHPEGYEYWGRIGFLKAGLAYADRITTVSPTYARELERDEVGMGLHGLIARRRADVVGVLNGIDPAIWDPAADPALPTPYGPDRLDAKGASRQALARAFGLDPAPDAPLFGLVSRLTWQKGVDLLLDALPRLLSRRATLAVLGSGEAPLETALQDAAKAHPGRIGVRIGYDERLSHLIQAGADSMLVPSRFEPCGLTQMYALRYGSPPVVARVGGLADSVVDANEAALSVEAGDGFQFAPVAEAPFAEALDRACDAFADRSLWRRLQRHGMARDVTWRRSAAAYAALYGDLAR
jgi:starch synthase